MSTCPCHAKRLFRQCMSRSTSNADEQKLLPGAGPIEAAPSEPCQIIAATVPTRQLSELPKDELEHLAEEFGLEPGDYKSRQHLVAAIHERRQMIASMDREALLDVVRWGRRPVLANLTK